VTTWKLVSGRCGYHHGYRYVAYPASNVVVFVIRGITLILGGAEEKWEKVEGGNRVGEKVGNEERRKGEERVK
jgi:hypothetical protein